MTPWLRLTLLGALGIAALATACGDDGEELTLQEYFQRLDAIYDETRTRSEAHYEGVGRPPSQEDLSDEEVLAYYRALYGGEGGITDIASDLVADLQKLNPPAEAAGPHNERLDATASMLYELQDLVEGISDTPSPEEVRVLFDGFLAANQREANACFPLQTVADENGVDVNLECHSLD